MNIQKKSRRGTATTKCARYAAATFAASSPTAQNTSGGSGAWAGGGAAGAMASCSLRVTDQGPQAADTMAPLPAAVMAAQWAGQALSTRSIGSHLSCSARRLRRWGCPGEAASADSAHSEKGHTRKTTPRTRASETPVPARIGRVVRIVTENQHCPRGTTISRSKRGPPGARRGRTMSPGMPAIRLQTVAEGSVGELQMTTSPICGRINPLAVGHSSTTSPDKPIVGSIDGPMHCIDCKT